MGAEDVDETSRIYGDELPPGELAIGVYGRSGSWLDSVGFSAALPVLVQKP